MNEDEMHALEPLAGEELERQLARYARVRLDPTPAQSRRARAAVMEAAWRRRLHTPADAAAGARRWRGPFSAWSVRRVATSVTAAVLAGLVVGSTAFAASRAGGPLYEARLSLEAFALPSEPEARLDAELAGAQARLVDLVEAAGRGDEGAIAAALGAYERSLDDLDVVNGAPASRALQAVQFHRVVLLRLMGTVSEKALGGLETALERSSGVIEKLGGAGASGADPAGAGGAGGPGAGGPGAGGPGAGGPGAGGPGAGGPGDKPDKSPAAGRSPRPDATPRPTKSPRPDNGHETGPNTAPDDQNRG